ncbi:unnamed protein product [Ceutorhynchus assimilis]|uniref:Uncharacterized protein n=1 Tax=Ceutorhynchus assimilis TaxID=467358 RepID=A0A9N9QR34_9CUCU|nr:unnamed protein product [Ceutorhynchus assimilis]
MSIENLKQNKTFRCSARLKMTTEDNGNIGGILKPTSSSNEDLSEYTDADESISAPTEFLAEILFFAMASNRPLSNLQLQEILESDEFFEDLLVFDDSNEENIIPDLIKNPDETSIDGTIASRANISPTLVTTATDAILIHNNDIEEPEESCNRPDDEKNSPELIENNHIALNECITASEKTIQISERNDIHESYQSELFDDMVYENYQDGIIIVTELDTNNDNNEIEVETVENQNSANTVQQEADNTNSEVETMDDENLANNELEAEPMEIEAETQRYKEEKDTRKRNKKLREKGFFVSSNAKGLRYSTEILQTKHLNTVVCFFLVLQYEPNNATAKEFYPLILDKLKQNITLPNGNGGEEGSSNDSEDDESDANSSSASVSESSEDSSEGREEGEEEEEEIEQGANDKVSKGSSEGDGTTGSYSSLEDDEAENDQLTALVAKYQIDNVNFGNGNKICPTTHFASSNAYLKDNMYAVDNHFTDNQVPVQKTHFMTSSDSESPTEPCQTVAMLRARVVPNNI